jgi:hypothetical protein
VTVFRFDRRRLLVRNGIVLAGVALWASTGDVFGISLLVLLLPLTVWSLRRPRLVVTDRGVTVANLLTTRRIKWSDITGLGYGEYRRSWCPQVELADGSKVPVRVLSDNLDTGGNPSERVSAIVAELRTRLEAHTGVRSTASHVLALDDGTSLDMEALAGSDVRARRVNRQLKWTFASVVILALFFIGFGISTAVDAAHRPHTYAQLRDHGVRRNARFDGCGHVDRFDKNSQDDVCRLTVSYQGHTRRWDYQDDYPQFDHLAVGARVPVLLDPNHPTTVYTVHDVETNDNAGIFSLTGLFGVGMSLAGVGILVWIARLMRRQRRDTREFEAELAAIEGRHPTARQRTPVI